MQKRRLGKFLKKKREEAGLSQRDVSELFGWTTPQFVSNWERSVSKPPITKLGMLAEVLKTTREELVKRFLFDENQERKKALCEA